MQSLSGIQKYCGIDKPRKAVYRDWVEVVYHTNDVTLDPTSNQQRVITLFHKIYTDKSGMPFSLFQVDITQNQTIQKTHLNCKFS